MLLNLRLLLIFKLYIWELILVCCGIVFFSQNYMVPSVSIVLVLLVQKCGIC